MDRLTALLLGALCAALTPAVAFGEGKPTRGSGIEPEVLYHNYCSVCHGDRGDGNSKAINSLYPPPKNFLQSANLDRDYMIKIVRDGKPGTAMVGWGSQLNDKEIVGVVDYLRDTFMAAALNPKVQRGKTVYLEHCVKCHGARGEGGELPDPAAKPARSFAAPLARQELYKEKMLEAVRNGKSGTYMISFKDRLKKSDIEAVVDYIDAILMVPASKISGTSAHGGRERDAQGGGAGGVDWKAPFPKGFKGDAAKGRKFYMANCAECHGVKGDGEGKRAYFINPKPVSFVKGPRREQLNRPALFGFIAMGKLGTEMPAWSKVINDQEIADVGEYVFQAYTQPKKEIAQKK